MEIAKGRLITSGQPASQEWEAGGRTAYGRRRLHAFDSGKAERERGMDKPGRHVVSVGGLAKLVLRAAKLYRRQERAVGAAGEGRLGQARPIRNVF